jgi:hypothetical protein
MDMGTACLYRGDFSNALAHYDSALESYGEGRLSRWELSYTRAHRCFTLEYLGAYRELVASIRASRRTLAPSEDRLGRFYLEAGAGYLERLAADDPAGAQALLRDCAEPFGRLSFTAKTWLLLKATVNIALYQGRGHDAAEELSRARPKLRQVLLTRTGLAEYLRMSSLAALAIGDRRSAASALRRWSKDERGIAGGVRSLLLARLVPTHKQDEVLAAAHVRLAADNMRGYLLACDIAQDPSARTAAEQQLSNAGIACPRAWLNMLGAFSA